MTIVLEPSETDKLAELLERADLVMLVFGEKKAALGLDMVKLIIDALRTKTDDHNP